MHLSKRILYLSIICYSIALLILQDYGLMLQTTGTTSALWLGKMGVDLVFVGMGLIRLLGPAFFASDDTDDEIGIQAEDLQFSDTALFGAFLLNLLGNFGWHAYITVMTTGGQSFYFSIWTVAEFFGLFICFMLWKHAAAVQKRKARAARQAAQAQAASNLRSVS